MRCFHDRLVDAEDRRCAVPCAPPLCRALGRCELLSGPLKCCGAEVCSEVPELLLSRPQRPLPTPLPGVPGSLTSPPPRVDLAASAAHSLRFPNLRRMPRCRGTGGWHKASVPDCLPVAAPIGLSPPHILTLRGPERVLVVSTEPPDDLSCLTTPGGRLCLRAVQGGGLCTCVIVHCTIQGPCIMPLPHPPPPLQVVLLLRPLHGAMSASALPPPPPWPLLPPSARTAPPPCSAARRLWGPQVLHRAAADGRAPAQFRRHKVPRGTVRARPHPLRRLPALRCGHRGQGLHT